MDLTRIVMEDESRKRVKGGRASRVEECQGWKRVKGDSEVFGLSNWKDGERRASMFVREDWELGLSMSS